MGRSLGIADLKARRGLETLPNPSAACLSELSLFSLCSDHRAPAGTPTHRRLCEGREGPFHASLAIRPPGLLPAPGAVEWPEQPGAPHAAPLGRIPAW